MSKDKKKHKKVQIIQEQTVEFLDQHKLNGVRLQKVLANASVASRRASEELIMSGRVQVNDQIITQLGIRVDPETDKIRVDGELIKLNKDHLTIALYKPKGVVSALSDPQNRLTLTDIVGDRYGRLMHIGRLDADSEGLLLMTNDGDLAQKIAHPSSKINKTYVVTVTGQITQGVLNKMTKGFELKDGFTRFDKAKIIDTDLTQSIIEVSLHSGKNRIIRRMFKEMGFKVTRLVRTQIASIRLGELKPGRTRVLGDAEVLSIEKLVYTLSLE